MQTFKRYLLEQVSKDLQKKMVFLGGPRQVGKTTLANQLIKDDNSYLNWDYDEDREKILTTQLPSTEIWLFDELHKYRNWRNWLKGVYDKHKKNHQIIVTGSARLDYYRYGGDSLQGRYNYLRLHPLSVHELKIENQNDFLQLLKLGGFPEPFFSQNEVDAKRWSRVYRTRLIRDDVAKLENITDLDSVELLQMRLPDLVGSPLSINALREELQKSHKAVARWLDILERVYGIFRITPFGAPKIRAVKKEQKHYHYDWTLISEESFRFENLVASHLLKWVHFKQDTEGEEFDLRYFRDTTGREVDFVITHNNKPIIFIECKLNAKDISPHLRYLKERFPKAEAYQLTTNKNYDFVSADNIRVCPAWTFLKNLI